MLILTRKNGEEIVIGSSDGPIIVKLYEIKSGQARIGVEAPKDVPVHRREFYDMIKEEMRQ